MLSIRATIAGVLAAIFTVKSAAPTEPPRHTMQCYGGQGRFPNQRQRRKRARWVRS